MQFLFHRNRFVVAVALFMALSPAPAQAALIAGDVALIGWIDNGSPDSFAFVTLAPISTGEVVYFTDNGWTGAEFRSPSATDGDGNETLSKWTADASIAAGTIIRSTDVSPSFTWTLSGLVPGGTSGEFAPLSLSNPNEQIYAFQGSTNLPLQGVTNHLFALDDTNGFENAVDSGTGNIPPGLTLGVTAVTLNAATDRFIAFDSTLYMGFRAKANWLKAIGGSSFWTSGATGTLPTGSINVVPEPSTLALAVLAALGVCVRYVPCRRRRKPG